MIFLYILIYLPFLIVMDSLWEVDIGGDLIVLLKNTSFLHLYPESMEK